MGNIPNHVRTLKGFEGREILLWFKGVNEIATGGITAPVLCWTQR